MTNYDTLIYLKNTYESLKYFDYQDGMLILKLDTIYTLPLTHIELSKLNPNIFNLKPLEIYQIIFLLELLYQKGLDNNNIEFIKNYVNKYLVINDTILDGSNNDVLRVYALSIPIYTSYDPDFINNPASLLIQSLINEHSIAMESGNSKGQKLVLKNPNVPNISDEDDNLENLKNAGFTAFMLILITVTLTTLYIIRFILIK